jgi:hypothetical protein
MTDTAKNMLVSRDAVMTSAVGDPGERIGCGLWSPECRLAPGVIAGGPFVMTWIVASRASGLKAVVPFHPWRDAESSDPNGKMRAIVVR